MRDEIYECSLSRAFKSSEQNFEPNLIRFVLEKVRIKVKGTLGSYSLAQKS